MSRERKREFVLYVIIAVVLSVVALLTLRRDGYLAMGDDYPGYAMPGNHALQRSVQLWGDIYNNLGSPQYAPRQFVLSLWGLFWSRLGLSGPAAQWLLLLALCLFSGLSTAFFARTLFPERRLIALIAGVSLPLSYWGAGAIQDITLSCAVGFFPLSAALLLQRTRVPVAVPRFAAEIGLLSLGFMALVTTPPLAVYAALWMLTWVAAGCFAWKSWAQALPGFMLGIALAVAANGWWGYAAYLTIFGSGGAAVQVFAGPALWSWVDQNASILNLLSMQASWMLPRFEFFPYDARYMQGYRHLALYWPLVFALVGGLFAPYRRRILALVAVIGVSLFIGKGYHAPFAEINAFLYYRLPFFWLFRDPQFEVDVTLYLALFVLAAVGISQIISSGMRMYWHMHFRRAGLRPTAAVAGTALVALLLTNGLIFLSGDLIPKTWLAGAAKPIVTPPQYWNQAAAYLNEQPGRARVLLLPNDDFYQMTYDWGFHGIDVVARTLISRSVVELAPDAFTYLAGPAALRTQYANFLKMLKSKGEPVAAHLSSLDIGWILQRNDIVWATASDILAPSEVSAALRRQPGIEKVATFGKLDIYRVDTPHGPVSGYDGLRTWAWPDTPDLPLMFAADGRDTPWLVKTTIATRPPPPPPPRMLAIDSSEHDSSRYEASLRDGVRVLVLHTTFSPGWQVAADGRALDWPHLTIDSYLNGWLVPPHPPAHVSIVYAPARPYAILQVLAAITVSALVLVLALYALPRRSAPAR